MAGVSPDSELGIGGARMRQGVERTWLGRWRREPPPGRPALPGGTVVEPAVELAADDPLAGYLMDAAGAPRPPAPNFSSPAPTAPPSTLPRPFPPPIPPS